MDNDGTLVLKLEFEFVVMFVAKIEPYRIKRRGSRRKSNEDSSKHVYLHERSIYCRISEDGSRRRRRHFDMNIKLFNHKLQKNCKPNLQRLNTTYLCFYITPSEFSTTSTRVLNCMNFSIFSIVKVYTTQVFPKSSRGAPKQSSRPAPWRSRPRHRRRGQGGHPCHHHRHHRRRRRRSTGRA